MKDLTKLFAVFVTSIILVGCSNGGDSEAAGEEESAELSLWIWDSVQQDGVEAAVEAFKEENPNIDVDIQMTPGKDDFLTNLSAALEAGDGPDVMWQSFDVNEYIDAGDIEPLDTYIEEDDVELSDYNENIGELFNVEDSQYGIPKDMDAAFVIYNKDIFDEYGIEYPTEDWTFEEMVATSEELQDQMSDNTYPLYFDLGLRNGFASLVEMQGGSLVTGDGQAEDTDFVDNGTGESALTLMKELIDKELVPHPVNNPDFNAISSLISNNVAMSTIPSWEIPAVAEAGEAGNFAAVPYPSVDGEQMVDTNGLAYVMNADTEHKEASWELIKFLTSDEGAQLHAENGAALPANNEAQQSWVETNSAIENIDTVNTITENVFLRVSSEYPEINPAVNQFGQDGLMEFYLGNTDTAGAVEEFDELLQEEIERQN